MASSKWFKTFCQGGSEPFSQLLRVMSFWWEALGKSGQQRTREELFYLHHKFMRLSFCCDDTTCELKHSFIIQEDLARCPKTPINIVITAANWSYGYLRHISGNNGRGGGKLHFNQKEGMLKTNREIVKHLCSFSVMHLIANGNDVHPCAFLPCIIRLGISTSRSWSPMAHGGHCHNSKQSQK